MKILILVQSVEAERYPELIKAQQETWDSVEHPDVEVLYYYPTTKRPPGIEGKNLYVGGSEHWSYMFINTIRAFREVATKEWDFVMKTDNSAYICKEELVKALAGKPTTGFYGGHLHTETAKELNTKFLWGEGYFLSRDIVLYLIDMYANMPTKRLGMDDCWIGNLLTDKIKWDESLTLCEYYKLSGILPKKHLYRCKNDATDAIRFDDEIKAMKAIHEQLV